ncbi:unnamed protein product [Miscanthus lutarioriparius]|uniref:VAN3-binding protein n=1 Tax=Miscanthus lutarioriparius TaxID=422564 RepID=A0A811RH11_9POAL|nr:unnamed protein product [Miscanthus lutarioriparius]
MTDAGAARPRRAASGGGGGGDLPLRPPEPPRDPLEFLSRSWSASAADVSRALAAAPAPAVAAISEDVAAELDADSAAGAGGPPASGTSFSFASAATSQLVLDRIMAPSEVSPLTSGRLSHSSGPLNGGGSLSDSPPVSPEIDDTKFCRAVSTPKPQPYARGGSKTVGRWLKDRKEKRKEETRAHNAQVHAAVSVAAVAAAVAAVAAATAAASSSGKDGRGARTDMAVASAATLVAAQCVEAAEALGADREHLAAAVGSAVNVRTPGDVATITAAAATALRGAATLRARALKEVCNVAAVIPVEKGAVGGGGGQYLQHGGHKHDGQPKQQQQREVESSNSSSCCFSDELVLGEENNFLGICTQDLLARGTELLKRTRKGSLHWKVVSVYINRAGLVMLKMKSKHVGGTITKKKKSVVVDVCRDVAAWPGRHLLEGGEQRRYFGLRTAEQRVIEFECGSQREYEMWTKGVARLLAIVHAQKR